MDSVAPPCDFEGFEAPEVGVHVRRGDKLTLMPGLEAATSPEQLLKVLQRVAPELRTVPRGLFYRHLEAI